MSTWVGIDEELRTLTGGLADLQAPGAALGDAPPTVAVRWSASARLLVERTGSLAPDPQVRIAGQDAGPRCGLTAVLPTGAGTRIQMQRPRPAGADAAERCARPTAQPAVCGMPLAGQMDEISTREAAALIGRSGTLWVDVRPRSDAGRPSVPGALRLSLGMIEGGELPDANGRGLIVLCEIGRRSLRLVERLCQAGLWSKSMRSGPAAWHAAALPLGR